MARFARLASLDSLRSTRFARLASLGSLRSTRFARLARMRYFDVANGSGAQVTAPARRLQVACAPWSQQFQPTETKKTIRFAIFVFLFLFCFLNLVRRYLTYVTQPRPKSAALCRPQTYNPAPAEECGAVSTSDVPSPGRRVRRCVNLRRTTQAVAGGEAAAAKPLRRSCCVLFYLFSHFLFLYA